MPEISQISGASIAILSERGDDQGFDVLAMQRDDKEGVSYRGLWEFPGGGRDPHETPVQCALRELFEETGVVLSPERVVWEAFYPRLKTLPDGTRLYTAFFVAIAQRETLGDICKGSEGKDCRWLTTKEFCSTTTQPADQQIRTIPDHIDRYYDFLNNLNGRYVCHVGNFCLQETVYPQMYGEVA